MIAPFVDTTRLAGAAGAPGTKGGETAGSVVLADVRWYLDGRSGRAAYIDGHIPGAVFVDMDTMLASPPADDLGRHPLPAPAEFAASMESLGIGDGDAVIAYDDVGGIFAARLVFMLRIIGHEAALLDGGLAAWDGDLESGEPPARPHRGSFAVVPWPEARLATIDDVADLRDAVLLDGRARERYEGGEDPYDPRSGHIPGAVSFSCRDNLDTDGRLLPVEKLRERLVAAGVDEAATPVVSYCGSGITACHNLLVAEHAGLGVGRLYAGSWSQWSRDEDRPIVVGPDRR